MHPARRVLPILDTELGVLQLCVGGSWQRFICADPAALNLALTRAVAPALWEADLLTLTVRVPLTGKPQGSELSFGLEPLATGALAGSIEHAAILVG